MTRIKICGVTSDRQALDCIEAGADAIGLNFVASSPRRVTLETARHIVNAVNGRALMVGVVVGGTVEALRRLKEATGVACLQLHGDEAPDTVAALLPHAYKAVRIGGRDDVAQAERMPGEYLMVDAKVDGALGGTGRRFDWGLVCGLAARRRVVLAGGLSPENVREAIETVKPWCVDVASGVEHSPGDKDPAKVRAFVREVRAAG